MTDLEFYLIRLEQTTWHFQNIATSAALRMRNQNEGPNVATIYPGEPH